MLRVNVGLSRKLSRDYNSTGFSVNLEGEVCLALDDPQAVVERIKEFYDLAEEALNQQVERYSADSAIASRDEQPRARADERPQPPANPRFTQPLPENPGNGKPATESDRHQGNGQAGNGDAATNKQVQFLLNLGKRQGLTPQQLEDRIEELLHRRVGVYQLTKREAGEVIDALNQNATATAGGNGRGRNGR